MRCRLSPFQRWTCPRDQEQPNPRGLEALQHAGVTVEGLRSKSWDEFGAPGAPHMDLVITVCDDAAGEVCPNWPGQPATAHWSYPAPSAVTGTEAHQLEAFRQTLLDLKRRLELLVSLPDAKLEHAMLQATAREMAKGP